MTAKTPTQIQPTHPPETDAVELQITIPVSRESTPKAESLRAARARLLSEYGPCAACHPELLIATARQIETETSDV